MTFISFHEINKFTINFYDFIYIFNAIKMLFKEQRKESYIVMFYVKIINRKKLRKSQMIMNFYLLKYTIEYNIETEFIMFFIKMYTFNK